MAYEVKENQGTLFNVSAKKTTEKHPDYTGNCNIGGSSLNISAWVNESKSGTKYLRLKFDDYKPKDEGNNTFTSTASDNTAEIPF